MFCAEGFRPAIDQELRMRKPHAGLLAICLFKEIGPPADGVAENAINERPILTIRELHRFVDGGVLRSLEKKQLIQSQPQQITRIVIEMTGTKLTNPKVEQSQVAQNAIEKFRGKGAIGRREIVGSQTFAQDRVGKSSPAAPLFQGGESDSA